jgi:acetylornithine deacetylase
MMPTGVHERLAAAGDDHHALALLRGIVAVPSVTGREEAAARWTAAQLRKITADVEVDVFAPERANTWARWGTTPSANHANRGLLFASHLDTVHIGGWAEHWAGTERQDPFAAPVVDATVWGVLHPDEGARSCGCSLSEVVRLVQGARRGDTQPDAAVTPAPGDCPVSVRLA